MNKEIAIEAAKEIELAVSALSRACVIVQSATETGGVSDGELYAFKLAAGHAIYEINVRLIAPLFREHREAGPEGYAPLEGLTMAQIGAKRP